MRLNPVAIGELVEQRGGRGRARLGNRHPRCGPVVAIWHSAVARPAACRGDGHPERVRIERFLAAGASIKGAARKFAINYHALRRHWRNHVSAEARATYVAGAGASKDQLEEIVADESLGLLDRYRIIRGALYKSLSAAAEFGDTNSLALLAGGCTIGWCFPDTSAST